MLNSPSDVPFNNVDTLGFVIRKFVNNARHVGILYKKSADELKMCDLTGHYELKFQEPSLSFKWCDLGYLEGANKEAIAAFLRTLEEEPPDVPYGFKLDGEMFDQQGNFIQPPIGHGLTCATWIIAVFSHLGFELVEIETWPNRGEDLDWQEEMATLLAELEPQDQQPHFDALAESYGAKRVRPEEVVACGINNPWPSKFQDVEQMAAEIIEELAA